jgi:hypothetical protein
MRGFPGVGEAAGVLVAVPGVGVSVALSLEEPPSSSLISTSATTPPAIIAPKRKATPAITGGRVYQAGFLAVVI